MIKDKYGEPGSRPEAGSNVNRRPRTESRAAGSQRITQSSAPGPRSLEIHIDELVLHGFSPGDRYPIAGAVERELTRLFIQDGLPPLLALDGEIGSLDGGAFRVAADEKQESRQESAGAQVARAIYGGLRG